MYRFVFLPILVLSSAMSQAAEALPVRTEYWKSDSFLRSFNGSYRPNSLIEPVLSSGERGVLVSVQDLMARGQRDSALAKIKGSDLFSKSAALQMNAGNLYFESGQLEAARKAYLKAVDLYPDFRRAHRNLAFVYDREEAAEAALKHLSRALQLGDNDAHSYALLGRLRSARGEASSALLAFQQAMLLDGENPNWKLNAARLLRQLNRSDEALPLLRELLDQEPGRVDLHLEWANTQLSLGELKEAASSLAYGHRVGALTPDQELLLGQLMLRQGALEFATSQLKQSFAKLQAADESRALDVVREALRLNEVGLAEALFVQLQEQLPEAGEKQRAGRRLLGCEIDLALDRREQAVKALTDLVETEPLLGRAQVLLARELGEAEPERALMLLERAAKIDVSRAMALDQKYRLEVNLERYEAAVKTVKELLQSHDSEGLRAYLEQLERLCH